MDIYIYFSLSFSLSLSLSLSQYIYIYRERERVRERQGETERERESAGEYGEIWGEIKRFRKEKIEKKKKFNNYKSVIINTFWQKFTIRVTIYVNTNNWR